MAHHHHQQQQPGQVQPKSPLTIQELQTKPWKYIGYKGFSEWAASDNDLFVIRRFDSLAVRTILSLQWRITKLEKELMTMDSSRSQRTAKDVDNGSFEEDDDERRDCLSSIQESLKIYYDFLNQYKNLRNEGKATAQNRRNVQNWLRSHDGAISPDESAFILTDDDDNGRHHHDDLFSMTATPRTPLRSALEKWSLFSKSEYLRRECPIRPQDEGHSDSSTTTKTTSTTGPYNARTTIYQADQKIDSLVNTVICTTGFFTLVGPLWILIFVHSRHIQLAVITICVALFLGIVQSVAVARPFESLAATAAYAAVLMVFIQIGS